MKTAVCPGSFDPVTYGHLDIVKRTAALFDKVVVLVVINPDKATSFSVEERVDMIKTVTADLANVKVASYRGLLTDYVRDVDAHAIVKGLRAVSDFEYEFQMALANKQLLPEVETLFLMTRLHNLYLSSSMVRQIAQFGGDISQFVPPELAERITERLSYRGGVQG